MNQSILQRRDLMNHCMPGVITDRQTLALHQLLNLDWGIFRAKGKKVSMFTESENHRMAEAGRDLWRSSCPIPLLKQGHLDPVVQDLVPPFGDFIVLQ